MEKGLAGVCVDAHMVFWVSGCTGCRSASISCQQVPAKAKRSLDPASQSGQNFLQKSLSLIISVSIGRNIDSGKISLNLTNCWFDNLHSRFLCQSQGVEFHCYFIDFQRLFKG